MYNINNYKQVIHVCTTDTLFSSNIWVLFHVWTTDTNHQSLSIVSAGIDITVAPQLGLSQFLCPLNGFLSCEVNISRRLLQQYCVIVIGSDWSWICLYSSSRKQWEHEGCWWFTITTKGWFDGFDVLNLISASLQLKYLGLLNPKSSKKLCKAYSIVILIAFHVVATCLRPLKTICFIQLKFCTYIHSIYLILTIHIIEEAN